MICPPAADDPHADVAAALHDVSNALTIILGWVSEARGQTADPAIVAHALQIIEDQARVARTLARGAIGGAPESADVEEALDSVVGAATSALSIQALQAGVVVVTETHGALARVVRAEDVRQVVTNLLINALAFSPRGSQVKVDLDVSSVAAIVVVEDAGPGVPAERHATIFNGDSTRDGGAGIGLRHGRALARAAGGDLELVPTTTGARFRLTWPRARSRSIVPPPSRSVPVLEGTRVLVVEDDEHVNALLSAALGARGAIVTVARDRDELARALAAGEHDAALMDLSPIAADVEGAVAALRHRSPNATLVFISGSSVGLPDAFAGEGVAWVRKPFEVSEIVAAVLKARGGRRSV